MDPKRSTFGSEGADQVRHFGRRQEKLSQLVARQMVADIVGAELDVHEMLPPEGALAERYGVGRSSLREAVRLLESQGIIDILAGASGGPSFTGADPRRFAETLSLFLYLSGASVADVITARIAIEPVAVRAAAENNDSEAMAKVQAWLDSGPDLEAATYRESGSSAYEFHLLVTSSSGNPALTFISSALVHLLRMAQMDRRLVRVIEAEQVSAVEHAHKRIAQAILAQDGAEAARLAQRHLERDRDLMIESSPELFASKIQWYGG